MNRLGTAIAGLAFAACASSAPITIEFTGSVFLYQTFDAAPVPVHPERLGTKISGHFVYDVRHAEYSRSETLADGRQYSQVRSDSGCAGIYPTGCEPNWGAESPIVQSYSIRTPWGEFGGLAGVGTNSYFGFERNSSPSDLFERVDAVRGDSQMREHSNGAIDYVLQSAGLTLFNYYTIGALFDDVFDLEQLPRAYSNGGEIDGRLQFATMRYSCSDRATCDEVEEDDASLFVASLDSVSFRRGVHRVPEPSSVALVAVAALAAVVRRRRAVS